MATTQSTSSSTAADIYAAINAAGSSSSTTKASASEEQQNRFLTLLVTQLKNQDPLNPMDNAQMTTQLAQINTVSGIEKLNTTLNSLVSDIGNTLAQEASSMIGKSVLVSGASMSLANGAAYGGFNLESKADSVTISIMNSSGQVVHTETLGAQSAGVIDFAWDGKTDSGTAAADGTYKFAVEASQGGSPVKVSALQVGTVSALVRSNNGFLLDLGSLGRVDFKDVQQIL